MDDNFSFSISGDLELYPPYEAFLPSEQTHSLQLWDEIGLLYKEDKQISGACMPIISFDIDPNAMVVTMSDLKKTELIDSCLVFTVRGA